MTHFQPCERRIIHGSHTFIDADGRDHRCPGSTQASASATPLRDRIFGGPCGACGRRGAHDCDVSLLSAEEEEALLAGVTHGRLLDGTVLCPAADVEGATVFLDLVQCPTCSGRLARMQGRATSAPAEPRALRPATRRGWRGRKVGAA